MSITLNRNLEARLRVSAKVAGVTVETYIERIARDDEAAEEELEALASKASAKASRSNLTRAIGK